MTEEKRPKLVNEVALLVDNRNVGGSWHVATLHAPRIARTCLPGQFVHLRIPGMTEHMLRRPFTIFDADTTRGDIDFLYGIQGFGTDHLSKLEPGAAFECEGPTGNGWSVPEDIKSALLVGDGTGTAALYLLAKQLIKNDVKVHLVMGGRTKHTIMDTARKFDDLLDGPVDVCTTNGTFGFSGDCTERAGDLLKDHSFDYIACSGPRAITSKVADLAKQANTPCQVWLGSHMGCGVGACLGCVTDTTRGRVRVCVDGPIFDAEEVIW